MAKSIAGSKKPRSLPEVGLTHLGAAGWEISDGGLFLAAKAFKERLAKLT